MRGSRVASAAALLAAWAFEAAPRPAFAVGSTDYSVTLTSGLYEAPPTNAATVGSSANTGARIDLPFEFPYFGVLYDHVYATIGGYITFGNDTTTASLLAQDPSTVTSGATADGACTSLWMALANGSLTSTYKWTAGTAPNRRFVVSFENVAPYAGGSARVTHQIRLFEGSGRIEFAYKADTTPSTWTGIAYSVGMVAPGSDPRWYAPVNTSTTNTGHPANDHRIDPRVVTISGRLMYDRLTPTAQGWGTTTTPASASFAALDLVYADGRASARGATDAAGNFQVVALPTASGTSLDLYASTRGPSAVVHAVGSSTAYARRIAQGLSTTSDVNVSVATVDAGADPTASFRGPLNVAGAIARVYAGVTTLSTSTIPQLSVTYDATSTAATAYAYASGSPADLTVAGPAAADPDTWDDAVIDRTYGRHVLASIAPRQLAAADDRLDASTDPSNAFTVGFGCALYAAVEGGRYVIDATSATTASVFDLETPVLTSARGPDVAGWVAAALYDLVDPANEPSDWTDGTVGNKAYDGYLVLASMSVVPDAEQFFVAWTKSGRDALALSRTFVAHGLLADDASEPNDAASEAAAFGDVGTRRDGLVLNTGSEDWFSVGAPSAFDDVLAEVQFNRSKSVASVELEAFDAGGGVLVDKTDSGTGPILLTVGARPAGPFLVRVRGVAGDIVPAYTLQVSNRLRIDHAPLKSWTSGVAYVQDVAFSGGVAPFTFQIASGTAPPGLAFDAVGRRVTGSPSAPGAYDFVLAVQDSGSPAHVDQWAHHVVVAAPLAFDLGRFVGFPAGRAVDVVRAHVGGTPPIVSSVTGGALPSGVSLAADDLRFQGTATTPGAYPFTVSGADAAGSPASTSTVGVVCVAAPAKKSPVDLPAHAPACGFYFDAVQGSTATIVVSNAPKVKTKRPVSLVVLGPDGLEVAGGKSKSGKGAASATNVSAAATGRYFAVVAAGDGDDEPLVGTITVKPPTKTAATLSDVTPGSTFSITFGALAGAKLSLLVKPDARSGASFTIATFFDPDGDVVPLGGIATTKGTAASLTAQLAKSGTWRVVVHASGGSDAKATYAVKLTEPKGGAYSVD